MFDRHVIFERHQLFRDARLFGKLDEAFAPLRLLDLRCSRKQLLERAIFADELGAGLDADARHARHIVDRIAGERLDIDDLGRRHAEFLHDFRLAQLLLLHRVIKRDPFAHQLHEVLVGGDDAHRGADLGGLPRIGGDEVIGFEIILLDAGDIEGAGRLADEAELRDEIGWRIGPVRLVIGIDALAEGLLRLVEDDGEMGGLLARLHFLEQLPQHVAEAGDGADREAVTLPRQGRQSVIGAENITGTVDQIDMIAGFEGAMFGHGPYMPP